MNYDPQVRADIATAALAAEGNQAAPAELDFDHLAEAIIHGIPSGKPAAELPTLPDAREAAALQLAQLPDYQDNRDFAIPHGQLFDAALKRALESPDPELLAVGIDAITKIYCEHLRLRGAMAKALMSPKHVQGGKMKVVLMNKNQPPLIRESQAK